MKKKKRVREGRGKEEEKRGSVTFGCEVTGTAPRKQLYFFFVV